MASLNSPRIISDLATTLHAKYTFALETSYGLVIHIDNHTTDNSLTVSIKDISPPRGDSQISSTTSEQETTPPSYKYRLFPEYQAPFLWYDVTWPGNPKDDNMVDEDDVAARYGNAWCSAYENWMDRYQEAFVEQECDLGSKEHPFPDIGERRAWVLDGMMVTVWLTLQPGVESVEYGPGSKKVVFQKHGLESIVAQFYEEFDEHLK